jgi:hypothetical protein
MSQQLTDTNECPPYCGLALTDFSSTLETAESRPTDTSSGMAALEKYWLLPVRLAKSGGFNRAELGDIEQLVAANVSVLQEAWNEYFGA